MGRIENDGITYVYSDGTGGLQSITDILQNVGTFYVKMSPPKGGDIGGQIVLCGLSSDLFEFEININQGRFNFIRNKKLASQLLPKGTQKSVHCFARWDPESIDVTVLEDGYGGLPEEGKPPTELFQSATKTPFTIVPAVLIRWARERSYLPTIDIDTSDEFFVEFVNIMQQLQVTIEDTGSQRLFWDFNRKTSPTPKAEPQVTAGIHLLLQDVSVHKDFQIVHQAGAAGGSLDFQINKALKKGSLATLAMEGKHAHAADIKHGLHTQLPAYMRAVSADFGIYLVHWFKGKHFDKPAEGDFNQLRDNLDEMELHLSGKIRIMHLDLSIPEPPSKR